ncbi:MAG TPA: chloride channel protein [Ktedonobacterales bacterium]
MAHDNDEGAPAATRGSRSVQSLAALAAVAALLGRIARGLPLRPESRAPEAHSHEPRRDDPHALLSGFRRYTRAYFQRWLLIGALIGVGAGVSMVVFYTALKLATHWLLGAIAGFMPPDPAGEGPTVLHPPAHAWLIPVATTLGGLLTGIIVYRLAPETAGGGTDDAIRAFHDHDGFLRGRVPAVKLVVSAITIGSGGSAGREGAAAQIMAGIGSWIARVLHLDAHDRRIAEIAGVGAGIGTIFRAPFAGAIFAAEVLYKRDLEADALFPTFIAAVVGYAIFGAVEGWTPVFGGQNHFSFSHPLSLVAYLVLGLCCGGIGLLFRWAMDASERAFRRLPLPRILKPALGGLLVGLIGIALPGVLGLGYGFVQFGVDNNLVTLSGAVLAALVFAKIAATALTLGSGGSGGDVAPAMVVGGFLGGAIWALLHTVTPGLVQYLAPGELVIVGMGAFFGGISKTPLAMILMVVEMTGDLALIVPAMLATMVAYLITGDLSVYANQVPTRLDSPAHKHDYALPLLHAVAVREAMQPLAAGGDVLATPDTPVAEVTHELRLRRMPQALIVEGGRLLGMLSGRTARRASAQRQGDESLRAGQVMSREVPRVYPDDPLYLAWVRLSRRGLRQLPVVSRSDPTQLVGTVSLEAIGRLLRLQARSIARDEERHALKSTAGGAHAARREQRARMDPLAATRVARAMLRNPRTVGENEPLPMARQLLEERGASLLVVDDAGRLVGIITRGDLRGRPDCVDGRDVTVGDAAVRRLVTVGPDETLAAAVRKMNRLGLRQLPVVAGARPAQPLGLLRRSDVLAVYGGSSGSHPIPALPPPGR